MTNMYGTMLKFKKLNKYTMIELIKNIKITLASKMEDWFKYKVIKKLIETYIINEKKEQQNNYLQHGITSVADQSRSLIDNNNMENKQQPIAEATKFDDWMRKINNTYYSNHAAMTAAYKKIKNEKI